MLPPGSWARLTCLFYLCWVQQNKLPSELQSEHATKHPFQHPPSQGTRSWGELCNTTTCWKWCMDLSHDKQKTQRILTLARTSTDVSVETVLKFVWKVHNASCTDRKTLTVYFQCMSFTVLWDRGITHHSFLDKVSPMADYALHLWWRKDKPRKGTCNSALIQISECSEPTKLLRREKLSKMLPCTGCAALQIYTRNIEW